MPSGYLHLRCATLAAGRANIAVLHEDAYRFGAQGPDPLFTLGIFPLRPSSRLKSYGKMLHTARTGRFLSTLCALAAQGSDVEKAFTLGFLTHYALDSTVHPYVYAHSLNANGHYESALHLQLEKNWDVLYYRRTEKKGMPLWQPGIAESESCWAAVAALLSDAMLAVYPENPLSIGELCNAFHGAKKLNRLTRSRIVYWFAYCLETLLRKPRLLTSHFTSCAFLKGDIENVGRAPWRALEEPDRVRNEGLAELFEAATARACELLAAAYAYFAGEMPAESLAAVIGNAGYDTGLDSLP